MHTDISVFKEIPLDVEEIAEQLDADNRIMDFVYMGVKDKRLSDFWTPVKTSFEPSPVFPTAVKIPSISIWTGSCLIFSERAHAIFRLMLAEYGEFLPLDVHGFTYYIFNNLTDVEPDMSKSWYADEGVRRVDSLVFGEDADSKLLFRSGWEGCTACFCSETFKQLCHEYEIEGLEFSEDLLNPGYLSFN
ncbi:MAG: hypothetical protein CSH37_11740 [Thalassolituus sp.]|nr:MAG: hypothetical protein CSH37_11740 [Thalassolituus sp.]